MNSQTKLIVITSNEDFIRQMSSNKFSINTRIIDLDDDKSKDKKNYLDLTLLAQLSELNSQNDQVYKRVLDSPKHLRSKLAKVSKKGLDLICVVCGDHAIGFNYDVLTCASCKAFFRRNAQYHPEKVRCVTGERKCIITHTTNRKCQRCRLEKCLLVGMRKDFILSEEEKQRRRERLEQNRNLISEPKSSNVEYFPESFNEIDRLLMDTDNNNNDQNISSEEMVNMKRKLNFNLSNEDWIDIENVKSNYSVVFQDVSSCSQSFDAPDKISALASWSQNASEKAFKIIHFFRHVEQFECLNAEDRFTLIKYNLFPICFLQKFLHFNILNGTFNYLKEEDINKRQQFFAVCYGASGIREKFKSLMQCLALVTEQDSTLIYLFLIVLLFSKGLSMSEDEPSLKDMLTVNRAQSHYIRLICNYLISKHGEEKAMKQLTQFIFQISNIQSLTKLSRDYFREQIQSNDMIERIAPLMQAVLNIG